MEENKPKQIVKPGLPEALHPEIGNGLLWEENVHHYLLRQPDASKILEKQLFPDDIVDKASDVTPSLFEKVETMPDVEVTIPISASQEDTGAIASADEGLSQTPNISKQRKTSSKTKKKAPAAKATKTVKDEVTKKTKAASTEKKSPKPGKRVRKAAKVVQRQEGRVPSEMAQEVIRQKVLLSPFTQWLKDLAGSDYVHPYDDDFALDQSEGALKEGISETFADLLAIQGYKERAKAMYLQLIEKYPEKSSFFAAKIEALQ